MSESAVTLEQIVSWLRSKERTLTDSGVVLSEVRERREHLPAASADFDADITVGRINAWISGEVDFEVLHREDGTDVLFRHEEISTIDDPSLQIAFNDFIRCMLNPDEIVGPGTPP